MTRPWSNLTDRLEAKHDVWADFVALLEQVQMAKDTTT